MDRQTERSAGRQAYRPTDRPQMGTSNLRPDKQLIRSRQAEIRSEEGFVGHLLGLRPPVALLAVKLVSMMDEADVLVLSR
jgi:hypothetical protein